MSSLNKFEEWVTNISLVVFAGGPLPENFQNVFTEYVMNAPNSTIRMLMFNAMNEFYEFYDSLDSSSDENGVSLGQFTYVQEHSVAPLPSLCTPKSKRILPRFFNRGNKRGTLA